MDALVLGTRSVGVQEYSGVGYCCAYIPNPIPKLFACPAKSSHVFEHVSPRYTYVPSADRDMAPEPESV